MLSTLSATIFTWTSEMTQEIRWSMRLAPPTAMLSPTPTPPTPPPSPPSGADPCPTKNWTLETLSPLVADFFFAESLTGDIASPQPLLLPESVLTSRFDAALALSKPSVSLSPDVPPGSFESMLSPPVRRPRERVRSLDPIDVAKQSISLTLTNQLCCCPAQRNMLTETQSSGRYASIGAELVWKTCAPSALRTMDCTNSNTRLRCASLVWQGSNNDKSLWAR